jgi:hypothetical protein
MEAVANRVGGGGHVHLAAGLEHLVQAGYEAADTGGRRRRSSSLMECCQPECEDSTLTEVPGDSCYRTRRVRPCQIIFAQCAASLHCTLFFWLLALT